MDGTIITTANILFRVDYTDNFRLSSSHLNKLSSHPEVLWERPSKENYNMDV